MGYTSVKGPTQAESLVVCSKYEEMYGKILQSLTIIKLYRGMSKLKVNEPRARAASVYNTN